MKKKKNALSHGDLALKTRFAQFDFLVRVRRSTT